MFVPVCFVEEGWAILKMKETLQQICEQEAAGLKSTQKTGAINHTQSQQLGEELDRLGNLFHRTHRQEFI